MCRCSCTAGQTVVWDLVRGLHACHGMRLALVLVLLTHNAHP